MRLVLILMLKVSTLNPVDKTLFWYCVENVIFALKEPNLHFEKNFLATNISKSFSTSGSKCNLVPPNKLGAIILSC